MQKYEKLREEYDALVYVINTIRNNNSRVTPSVRIKEKITPYKVFLKEYNKIYNKNGSDTNKYLKKYKELLEEKSQDFNKSGSATNGVKAKDNSVKSEPNADFDEVTAIKGHESYQEYNTDKAISSIALNPTDIGTTVLFDDYPNWFTFSGGNEVKEGIMTITYTDNSTENFDVSVFGDFEIRIDIDDGHNFNVKFHCCRRPFLD